MGYFRKSNCQLVAVGKAIAFLATVALWAGCDGDGIERVELSGKVSYRGQPVEEGYITLTPLGEGIQSGAKIIQGAYRAVDRGAIPVGRYKVQISWLKEDKSQQEPGFTIPTMVNLIPLKYNQESKLKLEVPSGAGSMTQDYILD